MASLRDRILRTDPARFNRMCAIAALVFLALTITGRLMLRWSHQDFPQYYMGGVMARLGAWDSLYPIPKAGSTRNPGFIEDSTMKPRYAEEFRKHGPGDGVRYMQPPPFALLLVPLSFLTYEQGYVVWTFLLTFCAWGVSVQAEHIHRICTGRPTHLGGILTLLIATSPIAHRWIRVQNMSPIMGVLIGIAVIGMIRNQPVRGAIAIWLGGLAKYATGVFLPLYIAMRQWRTLAWVIGLTVITFAISIPIMGWPVFDEYLHRIAPALKNTNTMVNNNALQGFIARVLHHSDPTQNLEQLTQKLAGKPLIPAGAMRVIVGAQFLSLLFILACLFMRWNQGRRFWIEHPQLIAAGACALMCWLLIFSPMYWEHYTAYLAPLSGWLVWEAARSRGRMVLVIIIAALMYVPWPVMMPRIPEPLASHILWATILMGLLATDRLWRGAPADASPAPGVGSSA